MGRAKDPRSWLMGPMPYKKNPTGEDRLWWGVVRQAAEDLRYGNKSTALDALEWLTLSGVVLISYLYRYPARDGYREVIRLVNERNRYHEEPLDIPNSAKS